MGEADGTTGRGVGVGARPSRLLEIEVEATPGSLHTAVGSSQSRAEVHHWALGLKQGYVQGYQVGLKLGQGSLWVCYWVQGLTQE